MNDSEVAGGVEAILDMLEVLESQGWAKPKQMYWLRDLAMRNLVDSARSKRWTDDERDRLIRGLGGALMDSLDAGRATWEVGQLMGGDEAALELLDPGKWRSQAEVAKAWARNREAVRILAQPEAASSEYSAYQLSIGSVDGPRPRVGPGSDPRDTLLCRSYVAGVAPGSQEAERIWQAIRELMSAAGCTPVWEGDEQPGSVWKDWLFRGGKKAAKQLAAGAATAVHDSYVRAPGAGATGELAQAAATLMEALGDREGAFAFDNLLIAQFRDASGTLRSVAIELSVTQRRAIHNDPSLLSRPAELLSELLESQTPGLPRGPVQEDPL